MGKLAIETRGLTKSFGTTPAVAGVDLAVSAGGVYGVLGPNGAGKTTTIRMLATLLHPDAGEAHVLGYDVVRDAWAVRSRVDLAGQFASVDEGVAGRPLRHRARSAVGRASPFRSGRPTGVRRIRQCTAPSSMSRTPLTTRAIPSPMIRVRGSWKRIRLRTAMATTPVAVQMP